MPSTKSRKANKQAEQSRQRIASLRALFFRRGAGGAWNPNYDGSGEFDRVRANLVAAVADWRKIGNPSPSRAAAMAIVSELQANGWPIAEASPEFAGMVELPRK